ncbi:DUF1905 domain-containing protein [Chitinophaga qingshengii]|uniref:DUF1905 domain-containing protein n=1 Tax=Chitinophaga qingshengii TaxID=1569794 RepID=A0ABR7TRV3_9BACT|nr:DUF1905 domain-containing protein [Chitinophaga qingshengii]MBC9932745.1 DUF1905 domain-containing protein [Chitinophaga qingshengii]
MAQKTIKIQTKLVSDPGKGSWTYIVWDGVAAAFGSRKAVKVRGSIDGHQIENAFLPLKDGTHLMGVNAKVRKVIGKEAGDEVRVEIYGKL